MVKTTIEGRRFSKNKKEEYSPYEYAEAFKEVNIGSSIHDQLATFIEKGLKIMEQEPKSNMRDSFYNLGKRLYLAALKTQDEKSSIENRLIQAIESGKINQLIETYKIESVTNKPNAEGKREWPELDKWVMELIKEGKKHQEIWDKIPSSHDECEHDFYKDGDQLVFKSDGKKTRKPISKNHFIKTKVSEIKKRYKMPPP
jgi:DNA-binding TFAR19-related protein (PDSD5 family)